MRTNQNQFLLLLVLVCSISACGGAGNENTTWSVGNENPSEQGGSGNGLNGANSTQGTITSADGTPLSLVTVYVPTDDIPLKTLTSLNLRSDQQTCGDPSVSACASTCTNDNGFFNLDVSGCSGTESQLVFEKGGKQQVIDLKCQGDAICLIDSDQTYFDVTNAPPVILSIPSRTDLNEGEAFTYTVVASDPDGDALTYGVQNIPPGATFDENAHTFTWTPQNIDSKTLSVIFIVSDAEHSTTQDVVFSLTHINHTPELSGLGNKTTNEDSLLQFVVSAQDEDGDQLVLSAGDLPSGASFDDITGDFIWRPAFSQSGNYEVTFRVTDGEYEDSETIVISVGDVNRPPQLQPIVNMAVNENDTLTFTISASDPDGDSVIFGAAGLPEGSDFNTITQSFSWTPTYDQAGIYNNVNFCAGDGYINSCESITITVGNVNRPPFIVNSGPITVDEGEPISVTVASCPDGGVLNITSDNKPSGSSFNDDKFEWIPNLDQSGHYTIEFSASVGAASVEGSLDVNVRDAWDLVEITDQVAYDPNIDNNDNVAYWKKGQVYFYDGSIRQISTETCSGYDPNTCNCGDGGCSPQIDDGNVVWPDPLRYNPVTKVSSGGGLFYYDGSDTISLRSFLGINNNYDCVKYYYPRISNGIIAWVGQERGDVEKVDVYYYDGAEHKIPGSSVTRVSGINIDGASGNFRIAWGGWVVTSPFERSLQIYYSDGQSVSTIQHATNYCQLPTDAGNNVPSIAGSYISFIGSGGSELPSPNNLEVCLYNLNTQSMSLLTEDDQPDYTSDQSAGLIAWQKMMGSNPSGLYTYDINAGTGKAILENAQVTGIDVNNGKIAWRVGKVTSWHVYYTDMNKTYVLSQSGFAGDPRVGNNAVVWHDQESQTLFMAKKKM